MFKQGPPSDGKSCVGLRQGNNIKFQKYCSTITRAGQIFRGTAVPIPSLGLGPPPPRNRTSSDIELTQSSVVFLHLSNIA